MKFNIKKGFSHSDGLWETLQSKELNSYGEALIAVVDEIGKNKFGDKYKGFREHIIQWDKEYPTQDRARVYSINLIDPYDSFSFEHCFDIFLEKDE